MAPLSTPLAEGRSDSALSRCRSCRSIARSYARSRAADRASAAAYSPAGSPAGGKGAASFSSGAGLDEEFPDIATRATAIATMAKPATLMMSARFDSCMDPSRTKPQSWALSTSTPWTMSPAHTTMEPAGLDQRLLKRVGGALLGPATCRRLRIRKRHWASPYSPAAARSTRPFQVALRGGESSAVVGALRGVQTGTRPQRRPSRRRSAQADRC